MSWNRYDLKDRAKAALSKNYWRCVGASFVLAICTGGSSGSAGGSNSSSSGQGTWSQLATALNGNERLLVGILTAIAIGVIIAIVIGAVISAFLLNPLAVGAHKFFVDNAVMSDTSLNCLGCAFKTNYMGTVKTMFLRSLYTFLWSLLFIIPGIVKAYEYRMIPYLLADYPEMSTEEAFRLSRQMMEGNKWEAFILDLSFIGWLILVGCTCGLLGIFYVGPYMYATQAELYLALCAESADSRLSNGPVANANIDDLYRY